MMVGGVKWVALHIDYGGWFCSVPDVLIDLEDFGEGRAFNSYILLMPPSNMHLTNELMMHHRPIKLHFGINGILNFVSFFAIPP